MPVIKADCDTPTKTAFKALAERKGTTEMQLLRTLVTQALVAEADWRPAAAPDRPIRGKLDVRLDAAEVEAARKIAALEGISTPRWVRKLVQRRLDREVIPFNPQEFRVLSELIGVLGPLNRSLHVLVAHLRAGGAWTPERAQVESLAATVGAMREQVLDFADRASNRYEAD